MYVYRVDPVKRTAAPADPPFVTMNAGGSGPRRLQLHPNGKFLYVNHETDSKVSVFEVNGASLKQIQTLSTLPADHKGNNTTAEIQIDQTGKWLYVTNRGHDSIAHYAVDSAKGTLTLVGHTPVRRSHAAQHHDRSDQSVPDRRQPERRQHRRVQDRPEDRQPDADRGHRAGPAAGRPVLREGAVTAMTNRRRRDGRHLLRLCASRRRVMNSPDLLISCRISRIPEEAEMSVLKKTVLLCVLAAAVVVAQGQDAKVFPPTADQKAEIHKKLAELSARIAALGSNKADPQLLADVQIYKKAVEYILRFPDEFFGAELRSRDDYGARYGHRARHRARERHVVMDQEDRQRRARIRLAHRRRRAAVRADHSGVL